MIRIKIEGKNIADLWKLECVKAIMKTPDGYIYVTISQTNKIGKLFDNSGLTGDTIEVESEQSESGKIIYKDA